MSANLQIIISYAVKNKYEQRGGNKQSLRALSTMSTNSELIMRPDKLNKGVNNKMRSVITPTGYRSDHTNFLY